MLWKLFPLNRPSKSCVNSNRNATSLTPCRISVRIYITVYSEGGVLQFTREGWPNYMAPTSGEASNSLVNYVPNGQFLLHNNIPATSTTVAGQITGDMIGSMQLDEIISHIHPPLAGTNYAYKKPRGGYAGGEYGIDSAVTTGSAGGSESRPRNQYLTMFKY